MFGIHRNQHAVRLAHRLQQRRTRADQAFLVGQGDDGARAGGGQGGRQARRADALDLHQKLAPMIEALFIESSPIPLKYLLSLMDIGGDGLRLPLVSASEATKAKVKETMQELRGALAIG